MKDAGTISCHGRGRQIKEEYRGHAYRTQAAFIGSLLKCAAIKINGKVTMMSMLSLRNQASEVRVDARSCCAMLKLKPTRCAGASVG